MLLSPSGAPNTQATILLSCDMKAMHAILRMRSKCALIFINLSNEVPRQSFWEYFPVDSVKDVNNVMWPIVIKLCVLNGSEGTISLEVGIWLVVYSGLALKFFITERYNSSQDCPVNVKHTMYLWHYVRGVQKCVAIMHSVTVRTFSSSVMQ